MKQKIAGILIYTAVWKESDTVSVNALLAWTQKHRNTMILVVLELARAPCQAANAL